MSIKTFSVSEIISLIKRQLEGEFVDILVEGEISNLSGSAAGHYYFTLSDRNSAISCALFKMDALRNPVIRKTKNGDRVIVRGPISVYAKRGSFQLLAKRLTPFGKGDLKEQFEILKRKLTTKGLFDLEIKKEIPILPKKVAIITALGGAALQDFLNIMKRRSIWFDITIIPAVVQGDKCPGSVIKAIDLAEKKGDIDVLVIARGGGSLEDLWGFNNESLVERVASCAIPVVSAIGHQVDYSLVDYASDFRCETPSSAAELLTLEQVQLRTKVTQSAKTLRSLMIELKSEIELKVERFHPKNLLPLLRNDLYRYESRLEKLDLLTSSDPLRISEYNFHIDQLMSSLSKEASESIEFANQALSAKLSLLESLNPENVLKRGYTMLETIEGKVLTSRKEFDKIEQSTNLQIKFHDGVGKIIKKES